ncbi:MAG: putative dehydrogenase [Eubacterium sp.]|nr:putative dehydrogenase [Eubacterium sp.]
MKVRFGIIGLGGIAVRFAKVLNTAEGVELSAVASREMERSKAFAEKYGSKQAYDNYSELIKDKEVDVVYVALTHNFHYEIVKECLNNGKGVICEKPFVLHKKEAEELSQLSKEKNVLLMEAMWTRFIPAFRKAREWVVSGKIGAVRLVSASFCFNFPFDPKSRLYDPAVAGGSLYDAGVYPIEFTTGILGENPTRVNGLAKFCPTGVDEFVAMNMSFESGALATLSCGVSANTNRDARVYGTEGNIVVYDFLGSRKCELYDNENKLMESFEVDFEDGFIYQIEHFRDLYLNKKIESEIIPHKDSIACADIFDQLMGQWGK